MTIALNIADFRLQFPAFSDVTAYPDALLNSKFDISCDYISPETFGDMSTSSRTHALYLMMCHLMVIQTMIGANTGNVGVMQSAQVGGVNISLVPPPAKTAWKYWLNTTPYGLQLLSLLELKSVGGFFVGGLPERSAYRKVGGIY